MTYNNKTRKEISSTLIITSNNINLKNFLFSEGVRINKIFFMIFFK